MDTALVTGGAGFLGSHVADHLLEMGLRVVVFDDLSGGFTRNIPDAAEFHRGSITDERMVEQLFERYRFKYVYHLAAYAAEGLSHFIRRFTYSVNLMGSVNLINAAVRHDTECFVFTSSIAVYGSVRQRCDERAALVPEDPYGIAKLAIEHDLRSAGTQFGLRFIIFRPHNVYGDRQNLADPYRNVVGIFMNQVGRGEPCSIFGDGTQTRAFSHVSDVTPTIASSVHRPEAYDQTFNIGADEICTVNELAEMVQRVMGRHVGVTHLPPRIEAQPPRSDHAAVRRVFGERCPVGLDEGLERMAAWAHTVDIQPPRPSCRIEIAKNLPATWAGRTHLHV